MKSIYFRKVLHGSHDYYKIKEKSFMLYLINFFGLNQNRIKKVFQQFGLNYLIKINKLKFNKFREILLYIEKSFILENRLRKKILFYKRYYVKNKHIKGLRSINGLPLRGQRTHSNAKTSKSLRFRY